MLPIKHKQIQSNHSILQFASPFGAALLYLIYITAVPTICSARDHYSVVLDRFVDVSPEEFMRRLDRERPPAPDPHSRVMIIAALPREGEVKRLTAAQERKLDSLLPVLRVHGRDGIYTVKILDSCQARLGLHARFVLLISETALTALTPVQLEAAVAHEIGHEYVWEDFERSRTHGDSEHVRELELFCDGIAAVTLARIGEDPGVWIAALERLYAQDRSRGLVHGNENEYPSLQERCRFIKQLRTWLLDGGKERPSR